MPTQFIIVDAGGRSNFSFNSHTKRQGGTVRPVAAKPAKPKPGSASITPRVKSGFVRRRSAFPVTA